MARIFAVLLAAGALAGCVDARGTFSWSVTVEPLSPGAWVVGLPLPSGPAPPEDLVAALAAEAPPDTVRLETAPDGRQFLRVRGAEAVSLAASVPAGADVEVAWSPLVDGVPAARLDGRAEHVRVVDAWTLTRAGACVRGEAIGAILVPEETRVLEPLPEPC